MPVMLCEIRKGNISFAADTFGAELHSLKLGEREYLWQCGSSWRRYAPVLFPFICSPKDRTYRANGKRYTMKANHGFARDKEFTVLEKNDSCVSYILRPDEETLAQYPYKFEFVVRYSVLGDGVKVENIVHNADTIPIYFYIGGHPAFNCPLDDESEFTDYYIEYGEKEHIVRNIEGKPVTLVEDGNIINVTRDLFDYDAVIIPDPLSDKVSLKSRRSGHSVTVEFPDSRCIAVWSPEKDNNAAFVCLEPWTSVPVYYDDDEEDIEKKAHAIKLDPGKDHAYSYTIRIS